jgi:hypothetical protein
MADDVIGPDAKAAAKTERDHWKRVQIDAGFAGGALSAAAGGAAIAVGVVAAVAAGPVIAALGAVWWASRKLVSVETAVEDPPRPDFREPVIPVALRVSPDGFDFEYSIQSAAFDFLQRVADNVSLVDAIVLANERIDGALLVDESAAADARTAEADQFIENLTDNAGRLVEEARHLASELRETPLRSIGVLEPKPPERLIDVMPESTQAAVFRAGMDVQPFLAPYAHEVFNEDPLGALADSLEAAAESSARFADTVSEQRPRPEPLS